jgi:hypothetical protein
VSLDAFCVERGIDRIDLLKMDIQGHENYALAGAASLLAGRRIGMIYMELNWDTDTRGASPASESIDRLQHAGYWFAKPASNPCWQAAGDWMQPLSDVVATPRPITRRGIGP